MDDVGEVEFLGLLPSLQDPPPPSPLRAANPSRLSDLTAAHYCNRSLHCEGTLCAKRSRSFPPPSPSSSRAWSFSMTMA